MTKALGLGVMPIILALALLPAVAQNSATPRTYLVKLSVPVGTKMSKAGDRIRAAIISPESLLNGYLEGKVERNSARTLVLRFTNILYKGQSTPLDSEVVDFVNSKGHKSADDDERPLALKAGAFSSSVDFWLDEGAELRVRTK